MSQSLSYPTTHLISVCICTYRRKSLLQTLESVAQQQLPPATSCELVVVDNDVDGFAKSTVEHFAAASVTRTRYVLQRKKGLSLARNTALASAQGNWVALIDDDEIAKPRWLIELFQCAQRFHADAVIGRVKPLYDEVTPSWVRRSGFFDRDLPPTGCRVGVGEALTGNALLRVEFLQKHGLQFSHEFNATGGEDTDFFCRLLERGGVIVSSQELIVQELVGLERAEGGYLTKRSLCVGEIFARVNHQEGGRLAVLRGAFRASANAFAASALTIGALPWGRDVYYRYYLLLARNIGKLRYYLGFRPIKMYE